MSAMVSSLLSSVSSQLTGPLVSRLGESEDSVKNGLETGSAALLGGIANHASDSGFMTKIYNLATSFGKGTTPDLGTNFVGEIFGSQQSSVTEMISRSSGLRLSSVATLLSAAVPSVLSFLGQNIQSSNLTPNSLGNFLRSQTSGLQRLLPAGLANIFGGGVSVPTSMPPARRSSMGWLLPLLIIAALIIAALVWLANHGHKPVQDLVSQGTTTATNAANSALSALGSFGKRTLPNNVELNIPQFGVENKLLDFIQSSRPVDDATWFDFDRLLFNTGAATLQPSSQDQLQNIANILKAYPNVHIKIGGYTDNTGDAAANLKLSADRANNVMDELVRLGVPASQLTAEGYGDQHPVADNSTEEGRARNRRISIRVTQK